MDRHCGPQGIHPSWFGCGGPDQTPALFESASE
jgi:hypothetical protein